MNSISTLKTENTKTVLWTRLYSEMRAGILKMKYFVRRLCVKGYYKQTFSASKYSYSLPFFSLERTRWSGLEQRIWLFLDWMVTLESLDIYIYWYKKYFQSCVVALDPCHLYFLCQIWSPECFFLNYLSVSQNCSVW